MSSVYNLLMCNVCMCSSLDFVEGRGELSGEVEGIGRQTVLGLVYQTPCRDWFMGPTIDSSADGQYAVALSRVIPDQVR